MTKIKRNMLVLHLGKLLKSELIEENGLTVTEIYPSRA